MKVELFAINKVYTYTDNNDIDYSVSYEYDSNIDIETYFIENLETGEEISENIELYNIIKNEVDKYIEENETDKY